MNMLICRFTLPLLMMVLTGCATTVAGTQQAMLPEPSSPVARADTRPSPSAAPPTNTTTPCPVTIPNRNTPPGEQPNDLQHGNGMLWTDLWPAGKVRIPPDRVAKDGSLSMKFGWWRGPTVRGPLTITGRRLDGPVLPLQASIPDGYGDVGFQASEIIFPTEGCWEVTGRAGGAELTFVTLVVKAQNQG